MAGQLECGTYLRKSVVKDDKDAESIQVQWVNNTAFAEKVDWHISDRFKFVDEGISASKGLERPDWLRMLEAIKSGQLKRLVVRDQARLSREDVELFIFLRTIEKYDVDVRDSYGRQIKNDLQTKVKGLVDSDYAKQISKNVREKKAYNASLGLHPKHRNRPYGYASGYEKIIPEEAKVLKEAAKRVLAGEKLYGIVKDFNDRGILKYSGKPWVSSDISKMLRRPENAGIRNYKGEEVAIGNWPCLWNSDQAKAETYFRKLVAKLDDNEAFSSNTARKHLLTGILICALCKKKLSAKAPSYLCNQNRGGCGKVLRNKKALDEFMIELTYKAIKKLPDINDEPEVDTLQIEIDALEAEREETIQLKEAGEIDLRTMARLVAGLDTKIKGLRKTQVKRVKLPVDDAESFLDATVDKQRTTIQRLFPVVAVKPTGRKGLRFHPDQLEF